MPRKGEFLYTKDKIAEILIEMKRRGEPINSYYLEQRAKPHNLPDYIRREFPPPYSWRQAVTYAGFNPEEEYSNAPLPSFEKCVKFVKFLKERFKNKPISPLFIAQTSKKHYQAMRKKYGFDKVYLAAGLDPRDQKLKLRFSKEEKTQKIISELWKIWLTEGRVDIPFLKSHYQNIIHMVYYHLKDDGKWEGAVKLMGLDPEEERKGGIRMNERMPEGRVHVGDSTYDLCAMSDQEITTKILDRYTDEKYEKSIQKVLDFVCKRQEDLVSRYKNDMTEDKKFFLKMLNILREADLAGPFKKVLTETETKIFLQFLIGKPWKEIVEVAKTELNTQPDGELGYEAEVCNRLDLCRTALHYLYYNYFRCQEINMQFCPKAPRNPWANKQLMQRAEKHRVTPPEIDWSQVTGELNHQRQQQQPEKPQPAPKEKPDLSPQEMAAWKALLRARGVGGQSVNPHRIMMDFSGSKRVIGKPLIHSLIEKGWLERAKFPKKLAVTILDPENMAEKVLGSMVSKRESIKQQIRRLAEEKAKEIEETIPEEVKREIEEEIAEPKPEPEPQQEKPVSQVEPEPTPEPLVELEILEPILTRGMETKYKKSLEVADENGRFTTYDIRPIDGETIKVLVKAGLWIDLGQNKGFLVVKDKPYKVKKYRQRISKTKTETEEKPEETYSKVPKVLPPAQEKVLQKLTRAADEKGVIHTFGLKLDSLERQNVIKLTKRGLIKRISRGVYALTQKSETEAKEEVKATEAPEPKEEKAEITILPEHDRLYQISDAEFRDLKPRLIRLPNDEERETLLYILGKGKVLESSLKRAQRPIYSNLIVKDFIRRVVLAGNEFEPLVFLLKGKILWRKGRYYFLPDEEAKEEIPSSTFKSPEELKKIRAEIQKKLDEVNQEKENLEKLLNLIELALEAPQAVKKLLFKEK